MARFRLSAVIPFVCSTVAFALLVVLVLAGANPHQGSQYYLISLNTSRVGDRLVEIKPTNDVARGNLGSNGDGNGGGGSGFLDGIGNIIPGLNTAIGNLTVEIDNDLQQMVTNVIHEAKETAGVKDRYNIYLQNICYGNLTRPNDKNAVRITDCPDFGSVAKSISSVSSRVQSYMAIGTTNVSIPFLETLGQSTHVAGAGLLAATTANAAFVYLGLVGTGMGAVLSATAVVATPPTGPRTRLLIVANVVFAALAPMALTVSAAIMSVVVAVLHTVVVGGVGAALTVEAAVGARALALVWAARALALAAALYWALVWFVDARQSAWLRTRRPADHLGCWRKTFAAARRGLKVRDFKEDKGPLSG